MNRTCAVVGATGFLGGFITAGLLQRGYRVIALVRPRPGKTPRERTAALMRFFNLEPGENLTTVAADIEKPGLGLPEDRLTSVREKTNLVFNCAADTSFAARRAEQVRRVNVGGAKHLFEAFRGRGHFHHLSTAYAAGRREGRCPETLEGTADFHNPYEQSKHEAERLMTGLCAASGARLTIHRPTVVYGDHASGKSLGFHGLYYPVRVFLLLRDGFVRDIRERDGRRARALGVSLDERGVMTLPVAIADTGGAVNLVPVDRLVRAVLTVADADACGVFHIGGTGRDTLAGLISLFQNTFAVTGLRAAPVSGIGPRSPLERLVDNYLEAYYPYFCDKREFDDTQAARYLGRAAETCPPRVAAAVKRCMDYAVSVGFGARLSV
jgi:nucleoside-diphosphate-sugar epimerase